MIKTGDKVLEEVIEHHKKNYYWVSSLGVCRVRYTLKQVMVILSVNFSETIIYCKISKHMYSFV